MSKRKNNNLTCDLNQKLQYRLCIKLHSYGSDHFFSKIFIYAFRYFKLYLHDSYLLIHQLKNKQ